ncbi:hypothetical protein BDV19DRAFT_367310 [Aspergillus venezuelensis]
MGYTAPLRPCKVVIVGGGISGLGLAAMLDRVGIDYTLLEAYDEIVATRLIAGIAMTPSGLRILDQLGCFEDLRDRVKPMAKMRYWGPDGEVLVGNDDWDQLFIKRYGYPMLWIERWMLLQVLYDRIADKGKLLTGKRAESVVHGEDGVEVRTTDGSVYRGDIVVGADGVHSRVRQEIARRAKELGVGEEYDDANEVTSTYACLFGVSDPVPSIPIGVTGFGAHKQHSYIIGTGPANTMHWSLLKNLGSTLRGSDIPQLGEKEIDELIKEFWDDNITPEVKVKDLYNCRRRLVYIPTREYVHKKWHLDRMIALGDASHKMTVIIAQGGNQALESVAALTNGLFEVLSRPTPGSMSQDEIREMFQSVQDLRQERTATIMDMSFQRQQLDALETPELEDTLLNKLRDVFPGVAFQRWDAIVPGSVSLSMLDIPYRPRELAFNDEVEKTPAESRL